MSCGVGGRPGLDPTLLWLWLWLAAVALIRPLAWKLPYAPGAALKRQGQTPPKTKKTNLSEFPGAQRVKDPVSLWAVV